MNAFTIALALLAADAPAAAAEQRKPDSATAEIDADQAQVERASLLIGTGKPAEAIALLDPLIVRQEKNRASETRQVYCARGLTETLLYTGAAAQEKKGIVVLHRSACYTLFLKGFALIDLKRSDEAKAYFDRALAMAPSNAHFLGELAEWHKSRRDWDAAFALFQRAEAASAFSPPDSETFDKSRAMRGQAFILVERGKLDEAEKLYRACLKLDPDDRKSKAELQYIAEQRGKKI